MATSNARGAVITGDERKVIFASSLGTVFEWYDFFIYGTLASYINKAFFTGLEPSAGYIATLLVFAAGFFVRPFGALVFGRLGDMIGRKYTFLVTILIMGLSTAVIGVHSHLCADRAGGCRHPDPAARAAGPGARRRIRRCGHLRGRARAARPRGEYTSWIQTTATLGLFLSLLVILGIKAAVTPDEFAAPWGWWRAPFIASIVLLAISVWIRLSMNESPAFKKMKEEGRTSKAPLTESFTKWGNLKIVLLALFGLVAGQGVVWYSGQFYAMIFLTNSLKIDPTTAQWMIATALVLGTPFFVIFGKLSDKIGRKRIIMAGMLLACLTYFPIFKGLAAVGNPALAKAQATQTDRRQGRPGELRVPGQPGGARDRLPDLLRHRQARADRQFRQLQQRAVPAGTPATISIGATTLTAPAGTLDASGTSSTRRPARRSPRSRRTSPPALKGAGYPAKAAPIPAFSGQWLSIVGLLWILMIYVTMVYGPIAAMLVELFPTRIRYTSMSLPYHIGNGWFGGLLPSITLAMVAQNGNMYYGLWYPIVISAVCLVIGVLFVKETKDVDIYARD